VIAAIGIALAVPSFSDIIERKQLGGAAEAAYEQLQLARSQAVKRSKPIVVDFNGDTTTAWAIGFTDKLGGCNAGDALDGDNPCTIEYDNDASIDYGSDGISDIVLMRIQGSNHKNITMTQATPFDGTPGGCTTTNLEEACFDFVRGLARTGEYNFTSTNYTLQVQVNLLGHVSICRPSGKYIVGYDGCD
jgi:type IV fimbrial biogenesis protein FimT